MSTITRKFRAGGRHGGRKGKCVYCGCEELITKDHIPPRNLFPHPRPSNLVTVPCCESCNKGFELDDEYFRLAITTGIDQARFPKEFELSIEAINKLKDSRKIRFAKRMLASLRRVPIYTPAGIYLGGVGAMEINSERLRGTLNRVIRGLFFQHSGRRLFPSAMVWTWSTWLSNASNLDPELKATLKDMFEALCTQPMHVVGKGVFRYSFLLDEEDNQSSAWWLSFYEKSNFLGGTRSM